MAWNILVIIPGCVIFIHMLYNDCFNQINNWDSFPSKQIIITRVFTPNFYEFDQDFCIITVNVDDGINL